MSFRGQVWMAAAMVMTLLTVSAKQSTAAEQSTEEQQVEYFEKHVRPIFVNHCYSCHSADTKPAGMLRVDTRAGVISGGNSGPAVVPGKPEESLLLQRLAHDSAKRMPQDLDPLSEDQIAVIRNWIQSGAVWTPQAVAFESEGYEDYYEMLKADHWAFQPVSHPEVPQPKRQNWARGDVDRFILSRLEEEHLAPVADADKLTLIRRLTYDLTGLPPTPQEIAEFLNDQNEGAYERVVDRLMSSPAFGEQWGRHWLDVARYAESTGPSRNVPYPHAWKYRDYVIESVNADIPFDRFLQEQIAGDLLPAETPEERNRLSIATGYLALGVKDVNQRFKERFLMDNVDEQIDVVTRSVLALTVSCARCHDHKFDPVPTKDYYALAGIFTSTDNAAGLKNQMGGGGLAFYVPDLLVHLEGDFVVDTEKKAQLEEQVQAAKKIFEEIRGTPEGLKLGKNGQPVQRQFRNRLNKLQQELNLLADPAQHGLATHGVRDSKTPADTAIRIRGEEELHGPLAARGFLTAFTVEDTPVIPEGHSGRLELSQWLTSPNNPMTSRVMVNRIWHHLFGTGLVSTVDNFGLTGATPSHPELLDHLASRFVEEGWSVKTMVRSLVLSRTYQLGAETTTAHLQQDPANTLLWRHSPRRLTAEELRDTILLTTGNLQTGRPEQATVQQFPMIEIRDNGAEAASIHQAANDSTYRSIYLPQLRGMTPAALAAFDPVEQTLVTGQRDVTTVPGQALFLMNSRFIWQHTQGYAAALSGNQDQTIEQQIEDVFQTLLNRTPTDDEQTLVRHFVNSYEKVWDQKRQPEVQTVSLTSRKVPIVSIEEATAEAGDQANEAAETKNMVDADHAQVDAVSSSQQAAWTALIQAITATAEFRYIQ